VHCGKINSPFAKGGEWVKFGNLKDFGQPQKFQKNICIVKIWYFSALSIPEERKQVLRTLTFTILNS
jgi:hypothetical protein